MKAITILEEIIEEQKALLTVENIEDSSLEVEVVEYLKQEIKIYEEALIELQELEERYNKMAGLKG